MGGDLPEKKRLPLRGHRGRQPDNYRPGPFALVYTALLAAGTLAAAVVYLVLVHGVPGMAANRADTLKTALLVIGGSGALAGLYVAYRKQRTDEANHLRDQDKLFTERYTQAAAQLGAPAAAVRLAGVYALARIADDSERDRPTCLKVLCAYLRMPYQPDTAEPAEREVRTTAQTVLAERLDRDHPGYWRDAYIDLRGAHLIDLDFSRAVIGQVNAERATFAGIAQFDKATFTGCALFTNATFTEDARFCGATFTGDAWFNASFSGDVWFDQATLNRAVFDEADFTGDAWFIEATFTQRAQFREATFVQRAGFLDATFTQEAWFDKATFTRDAVFNNATFTREAVFREATFTEGAYFKGAAFTQEALFGEATFTGRAIFVEATLNNAYCAEWPDGLTEPLRIIRLPLGEP